MLYKIFSVYPKPRISFFSLNAGLVPFSQSVRLLVHRGLPLLTLSLMSCFAAASDAALLNPDYSDGRYFADRQTAFIWGSDGVISASHDGLHWHQVNTPSLSPIRAVAADPASSTTYYAVGDNNTLLVTRDSGQQWKMLNTSLPAADFSSLVIRHNGQLLIAGTNGLLATSQNLSTWQPLSLKEKNSQRLLIHETRTGALLLAGSNGLLARSENATDWKLLTSGAGHSFLGFREFNSLLVLLAEQGRLLLSTDDGHSWRATKIPVAATLSDAAFNPGINTLMISAHTGDYFVSTDTGETWQRGQLNHNGQPTGISSVNWLDKRQQFVATGHNGMTAVANQLAQNWQTQPLPQSTNNHQFIYLQHSQRLIAFGRGGELWAASGKKNQALQWQHITPYLGGYYRIAGFSQAHFFALGGAGERVWGQKSSWSLEQPDYPNANTPPNFRSLLHQGTHTFLATGPTGAIMQSTDAGEHWSPVLWTPFENNHAFTQLLANPVRNDILAMEAEGRFFVSKTQGQSWMPDFIDTPARLWQAAINPATGDTVAVGQQGQLAFRGGKTGQWELITAPVKVDLYAIGYSAHHQSYFATGDSGTLLRSPDGRHWKQVFLPTTSKLLGFFTTATNHLIVFGQQQTILHSTDGGDHWQSVHSNTDGELRKVIVRPGSNQLYLIGNQGLLLSSNDEGHSWKNIPLYTRAAFRDAVFNGDGSQLFLTGEKLVLLNTPP